MTPQQEAAIRADECQRILDALQGIRTVDRPTLTLINRRVVKHERAASHGLDCECGGEGPRSRYVGCDCRDCGAHIEPGGRAKHDAWHEQQVTADDGPER